MYSKVTCFVILVCVLAFGSAAQAQLLAPPINNPSFEATDLGAGGTGQWVDYAEEWIINAQGNCYLEDGSWQIVAPDGVATLKMWNGAAIWQQIGSWTPNTDYEIGLWVGRGLDTSDIQVELWAGGSPALVPDSGFGLIDGTVGAALIGGAPLVPTVAVGENEWMSLILNTGAGFSSGDALWLRIESTGEAAWVDNIAVVSLVDPALAYNAGPAIGSTDVLRDVVLTWTAGIFAQKHDVYFGTNLDDVANAGRSNPLDVLLAAGQDTNGYDVGRLEFGQTYFWRIDEVNSPPDSTLFKGDVWSFTVEPFAYPIPGERITAIASSQQADQEAQRTIDGSGLDLNDLHSPDPRAMWISEGSDPGSASIQYEFDKPYKLHEMSVWNYNGNSILSLYGLKEVSIEYAIRDENLTVNPSFESPDLGPGGTGQWADRVDNWIINNQGNCYLEDGSWDIAAPDGVATLKMWSGAAIWQQIGNVRPNTDYEISLFIGRGHESSAVQVELWAGGDPSALPTSYGIIGDTVGATLIGGAALTPSIDVGQSELMGLSLNAGADFGPEDALWIRIESISAGGTGTWVDNVRVAGAGANWSQLENVPEFAQAIGDEGYAANTKVAFNGAVARYVKITAHSNWGGGEGLFDLYGLSEVRFTAIPVSAGEPNPEMGATDVAVDAILGWRPGREAVEHKVYLSTDQQAVIDGSALITSTDQSSYSPALAFGSTYFWRVDEVNNAELATAWTGDVWQFSTQEYRIVDDFESYNDVPEGEAGSRRVYDIWQDGYDNPAINGSTMGYLTETSVETENVHGGNKSVPLLYDNTTASISEVTVNTDDLPIGSNWSIGSPQALVLWLRGDPDNNPATDQLYVELGNTKVTYEGDISLAQWRQWSIDLTALGTDLDYVSTMKIGFERSGGSGGKGVVLLDDIMLYGIAPVVPLQPDPEDNLTVNPSFESPDLGPGGTEQWADYVDNWIINTQGSSYLEDGTWDIVASDGVATLKMWNGAAIWQQIGNVLPNTYYEISLFIGRGHDTSAVQVELWAGGDPSALPTSYGIIGDTVGATLIGGAALTPTIETGQSELMGLSLNTGADFGPQDALWIRIQSISGDGSAAWVDNVMVARPGVNLTVNPSFESPDLGPGGTGQWADHVDNWIINNQGNCYLEDGSWDITAADGVAALKMWSGAAIWQQIGNVLPNTDYEISLFIGRGHDTSAAQVELWAGGDPSALPASYGVIGDTVGASLIGGAALTPTIEVGQSELMSLSLNTGADFGPQDALWIRIESISAGGTGTWVDNVMVTSP